MWRMDGEDFYHLAVSCQRLRTGVQVGIAAESYMLRQGRGGGRGEGPVALPVRMDNPLS